VVDAILRAAGWHDVTIDPVDVELRLGADAPEAADYVTSTGIARAVLDTLDDADRARAVDAVTEALLPRESADGVHLSGGVLVVRATGPAGMS